MSQKEYKNFSEIDKKYKWDLTFLLEGDSVENRIDELLNLFKKQVEIKESKYENSDSYLNYLHQLQFFYTKFFKLKNYLNNSQNLNVIDSKIAQLSEKLFFELNKIEIEIGAEDARFFDNANKISKWLELPEYAEYKFYLENKLEEKKHKLSKQIEEFRQTQKRADIDLENVFSILVNSEIDKGFALDSKGKKHKITSSNIYSLRKNEDKILRKNALIEYQTSYYKFKETLSNLLYNHKKEESTYAKIFKFDSSIDFLIFNDRVQKEFILNLFEIVTKNVFLVKRFRDNWKKFYFAKFKEKATKYDYLVDLIVKTKNVTINEAINDIKMSLKPFGEEYNQVLKKAFDENWIDFFPVVNKTSGAYSIGASYGIDKKLILMNWDNTSRSTETLIHELGHSMHSYFSDKHNNLINSQYKIFVAEIASIFNELMLMDYWMKNSKDDEFKFHILSRYIDGFIGSVFVQTEWSNYEFDFYEKIDRGVPLNTYEAISKIYYENAKKYSIESNLKYKTKELIFSIAVPHFYYEFYVYKYAIGQLAANIFFQKYKENGDLELQNYINNFLSKGCQANPIDILKVAGVDLMDKKVIEKAFLSFEENVNQWIKLGNNIFNKKIKKEKNAKK